MIKIKDFITLAVVYDMKYGKDKIYQKIINASIISGIKGLKAKDEKNIIYNPDHNWLPIVKQLNIIN